MYPSWGNYGGGHHQQQPPPPHFGVRPSHLRGPPPTGGGFGGFGTTATAPAQSNFSSLREQHLQQMQQLQQLHQKQLQSVLHHNNGPYSGAPPGAWQDSGPGFSNMGPGAPSPTSYQDQQPPRGPPGPPGPPPPPQTVQQPQADAQRPPPDPAPAPPTVPQNSSSTAPPQTNQQEAVTLNEPFESNQPEEEKPDFSTMTLQEQQQYWYKQHLQNLQRLKNEKAKQNKLQGDSQPLPPSQVPPPPMEPPKNAPPPPPPKEEPPPPPPPDDSKPSTITPPGDPAEAARLQQLQAAAAQWQQTQQQRAGYQYQALMQQHAQLQQVLQQYQQFIQQPAHLQTMPVDMQLRHYEVQQQQFAPVYQEWDRQFRMWQEQFQTYPHKDQLQDYECQWKQWQDQMKSTSAHLQERVTTLRAMQHQYGSAPYGGMMGIGQYGQYRHPTPDTQMPSPHAATPPVAPPKVDSTPPLAPMAQAPRPPMPPGLGQQGPQGPTPGPRMLMPAITEPHPPPSTTSGSAPPTISAPPEAYPAVRPPIRGLRPPGAQPRSEGPRGPRFEGPRGNGFPRFEPPPRFNAPPRFEPRQRFDQPLRGNQPAQFGVPGRFEPPRPVTPSRFESPPGTPLPTKFGPPPKPDPVTDSKPKVGKDDPPSDSQPKAKPVETPKAQMDGKAGTKDLASQGVITDDIMESGDGFFIQNDPIPQTTVNKAEDPNKEADSKPKLTPDTAKTPTSAEPPVPLKQTPANGNKSSLNQSGPPLNNSVGSGPPQRPRPLPGPAPLKPEAPEPPPGFHHQGHQMGPAPMARGRGRARCRHHLAEVEDGASLGGQWGLHTGSLLGLSREQRGWNLTMAHRKVTGCRERRSRTSGRTLLWTFRAGCTAGGCHLHLWRRRSGGRRRRSKSTTPRSTMKSLGGEARSQVESHWSPPEGKGSGRSLSLSTGRKRETHTGGKGGLRCATGPHSPMRSIDGPPPPHGFRHPGPRRPPFPHEDMEHNPRGPPLRHDGMECDPMGPPLHRDHGPPRGQPLPHPDMLERDMRRPPPQPREILERDPRGLPPYNHDPMDRDPGWPCPPHEREARRPPLPQEVLERRGPPMGHDVMRRPPPAHDAPPDRDVERGVYEPGYGEEFAPEDEEYRRPPTNFRPRDYDHEEEYYPPRGEWEGERRDRDYPPYPPRGPPERFQDDQWADERDRLYPYESEVHERGELRVREYPDEPRYRREEAPYPPQSEWDRPLPERNFPPSMEERRPPYEGCPDPPVDLAPPAGPPPAINPPETPIDQATPGTGKGILALSQRQHEIILKAAQELKMIRERQENKNVMGDFLKPETAEQPPEIPPGLLGLEITSEVRSALQATSLLVDAGQAPTGMGGTWEAGVHLPGPDPGFRMTQAGALEGAMPAPPKPAIVPKTVDYGHGHDGGSTVERISYGERIVLRPDPLSSERPYEKEPLGPRDPYDRDPYYDRRADPYMDRRDYGRERDRDMYRDKPPMDYERERYERERYLRDDRLPPGPPPRPGGYRERDVRDTRDRERDGHSGRDREEHYGRPGYDRPPYDRGPERPAYDHGSSAFGSDRRTYPEERLPVPAPSLPPPPPAPQRVEKKPETKNVDDILKPPGRGSRPERIVIIMRGLPGSGKSHVAKLIRDKEVECGGAPPRVLGLDDYFMTEVEKVEKDPDTGKRVKSKVLEYEYEPEMEETYRSSMLKTFRKTLDDGFFPFIIIDAINDRVKYFDQFWSAAKTKGFEVYLAEITTDNQTCAKRNVHGRKLKDITKMASNWEGSPRHMVRLDIRSLLQDAAIEEVEMEDFNPSEEEQKWEPKELAMEEEEGDLGYIPKSKWEMDTSEAKLDKLDGLVSGGKRKRDSDGMSGMEDFLQLPDDYATRMSEPGKKRVRWADLEEKKDADRKRAIGFVVGQTDWEKITDESGQLAQRALNRTKYF
ncbi:hypothetical protein AAFF_G00262060 [Aldrovandia affinis]|uniref:YLP motif-containing protein 1 n=1 Tax=Aldrovandia affinis TaxID=143900 RepID=A0AAD7SSQ0_9TELE|nr:hypothetical protein AAFF_G00262060 [Aldrovandia affinis]